MSKKDKEVWDALNKWLDFEEPAEPDVDRLKAQLAMETDQKKRKALEEQIKIIEESEKATVPTDSSNRISGSH